MCRSVVGDDPEFPGSASQYGDTAVIDQAAGSIIDSEHRCIEQDVLRGIDQNRPALEAIGNLFLGAVFVDNQCMAAFVSLGKGRSLQ